MGDLPRKRLPRLEEERRGGAGMDGHFVAAAEIHHIGDRYYLAGTWNDHGHLIENIPRRYNVPTNQTQLLVADTPDGPFKPLVPEFEFCLGPGTSDIIDTLVLKDRYRF